MKFLYPLLGVHNGLVLENLYFTGVHILLGESLFWRMPVFFFGSVFWLTGVHRFGSNGYNLEGRNGFSTVLLMNNDQLYLRPNLADHCSSTKFLLPVLLHCYSWFFSQKHLFLAFTPCFAPLLELVLSL